MGIRARACIKCREYVVVHAENSKNMELIKKFEKAHSEHTLVTADLSEVKGAYKRFKEQGNKESSTSSAESHA